MFTRVMKAVSLAALVLALLWPSSGGYKILVGFAVCAGVILAVQASRAGKYFREAECTTVSRAVKYEN